MTCLVAGVVIALWFIVGRITYRKTFPRGFLQIEHKPERRPVGRERVFPRR